jgi:hypothetical protein
MQLEIGWPDRREPIASRIKTVQKTSATQSNYGDMRLTQIEQIQRMRVSTVKQRIKERTKITEIRRNRRKWWSFGGKGGKNETHDEKRIRDKTEKPHRDRTRSA